jgi:hypothetical protein
MAFVTSPNLSIMEISTPNYGPIQKFRDTIQHKNHM